MREITFFGTISSYPIIINMQTQFAMDPYQILGVRENTPLNLIRAAYRSMSAQYHPDKTDDSEENRLKFFEVNEAFKKIKSEVESLYGFLGLDKDADAQSVAAAYHKKHDEVRIRLKKGDISAEKEAEKLRKIHNIVMSELIENHSHGEW